MSTPLEDFITGLSGKTFYYPTLAADPYNEVVGGLDLTPTGSPTTGVTMTGIAAGDTGISTVAGTSHMSAANNAAFNPGTSDFSVSFEIILPASDATIRYLVAKNGDGGTNAWDIRHQNNNLNGRIGSTTLGNSDITSVVGTGDSVWILYEYDRDGNNTRYINGVASGTTDISAQSATNLNENSTFYVMRRNTAGNGMTGTIAHLFMRTTLWTSQERTDYAAARASTGSTTITVYAESSDTTLGSSNLTWATAVAGSSLFADPSTQAHHELGASLFDKYYVNEVFLAFDTSSIGADATITSAVLSVYGKQDNSTTDFTIECAAYNWGAAVDTGDWIDGTDAAALTVVATRSTSGWSTAGYNDFSDAGAGLDSVIAKTGTTRLALWPERVRTGSAPANSQFVQFWSADEDQTGERRPKLTITYTDGGGGAAAARPPSHLMNLRGPVR